MFCTSATTQILGETNLNRQIIITIIIIIIILIIIITIIIKIITLPRPQNTGLASSGG